MSEKTEFLGHHVHASYHRWMLRDEERNKALKAMIKELVRPGDVVADVGAGTGILSAWAVRAGASRVYAVEASPIARLARRMVADNGLDDRITVVRGDCRTVELPEQVDVVFSECLGNFAFSDAMFLAVGAFCDRWLKPGGRRGPTGVRIWLQPADGRLFADPTTFFREPFDGLDLSCFIHATERRVEVCDAVPSFLWDRPKLFAEFDPLRRPASFSRELEWELRPDRPTNGVVGWFDVDWAPNTTLSTSPAATWTHWSQSIFHLPTHAARPGDRLRMRLEVFFDSEEIPAYRWSGAFLDADGRELRRFLRDTREVFGAPSVAGVPGD